LNYFEWKLIIGKLKFEVEFILFFKVNLNVKLLTGTNIHKMMVGVKINYSERNY